jgi:hypothetical protein
MEVVGSIQAHVDLVNVAASKKTAGLMVELTRIELATS